MGPESNGPEPSDGPERVGEVIPGRQETGGHEGEESEADEGEGRRERQRVAPERVPPWLPAEEVEQGNDGHHEVGRAIEGIPEPQEEMPAQEPGLNVLLLEEAEEVLHSNDALGIVEGLEPRHRL